HLARRPRSWREILRLYLQAAHGLAAAHARSIVHRDFKPGNVLVDAAGRVRVTDFGLARLDRESEDGDERSPRTTTPGSGAAATVDGGGGAPRRGPPTPEAAVAALGAPLTAAGALVGTPRYMAPEQREGRPATLRSDQYAFCISLWESLFGEVD